MEMFQMNERLMTKKYIMTVEGETEKWYFDWLCNEINNCPERSYNISIDARVQRPIRFYKTVNTRTLTKAFHICDIESNSPEHTEKFTNILSEMKDAHLQKKFKYELGYSNYTFELWIILHKMDCNGSLAHRKKYLNPICRAFEEKFEDLNKFKQEAIFKRCLKKISIEDVKQAIRRAEQIMSSKEKAHKQIIKYKGYSY